MKNIDAEKLIKSVNNYQEEAKAALNPTDGDADYYKGKIDACEDMQEIIDSLQKEQPNNMIQWTGNNLKEVIDFTGKSPRFEEWFSSWEEYENYVHSHNDILKLFCEDGSHYEVPVGAWVVKTPDGYNVPSVAKYIQQGLGVKIGETKIYLEDDGDESPYTQEWLSLETTEFKIPDGAFKDDDEVEVFLRKKQ